MIVLANSSYSKNSDSTLQAEYETQEIEDASELFLGKYTKSWSIKDNYLKKKS